MIKKVLLLCFITVNAFAEETYQNQMVCDSTTTVFQQLKKEYGEMPVMIGKAEDVAESTMTIWTNPATNSWSIVATKKETSCIIGVGQNLKVIEYKRKNML